MHGGDVNGCAKGPETLRCLLGLMGNAGKDASQGQRGGKEVEAVKKKSLVKNDTLQTMETSPCQIFFLILRFVFLFFPPVPQNSVSL